MVSTEYVSLCCFNVNIFIYQGFFFDCPTKRGREALTYERTCGFKTQQRRLSAELNCICPLGQRFISVCQSHVQVVLTALQALGEQFMMTYQCISPSLTTVYIICHQLDQMIVYRKVKKKKGFLFSIINLIQQVYFSIGCVYIQITSFLLFLFLFFFSYSQIFH